jgi:hypothetical protein
MIWLIKQAMLPLMPSSADLPGLADTQLDAFLQRMRREADPLFWAGIVAGSVVYAATPLITLGVPLPAFVLPARLRMRHAARLLAHRFYPLRQAMLLVRYAAGLCWGADPTVRAYFALAPYPADPGTFRSS